MVKRKDPLAHSEKLRDLATRAATAALTAAPGHDLIILDAVDAINSIADSMERKSKRDITEPAINILPCDSTVEEFKLSRCRQSTKRGTDVYLPSWSTIAQALPNTLLRSAIFGCGRSVQAGNDDVLDGKLHRLVTNLDVGSFKNMRLTLSGYELCQFDRKVYSACLNYYRERPLVPESCTRHVKTSFYQLAQHIGSAYSVNLHKSIRASLLRLSFAQLRMRFKDLNLELPKLLSVSFEDGDDRGEYKGSDKVLLQVTESVAELFGPGSWSAVELEVVGYAGLKGWLASFYATHQQGKWLHVETLYRLSGYESHLRNFKQSLVQALEKLKEVDVPLCSRVKGYHFDKDESRLLVVRSNWRATLQTDELVALAD